MAKVKGGTDGSISGAIGPVVFYKLRGKSYARSAPKTRSEDSWSNEQKSNRNKVSRIGEFWRHTVPVSVKQIFKIAAGEMTGYTLFFKINFPAFNPGGSGIDPEWLHLSAGKLALPHKLKAENMPGVPGKVQVSWQDDSGSGHSGSKDELTVIFYHEQNFTGPISTGAVRGDGTAVVELPAIGGTIQGIYLSFASVARKLYSADQYFEL